MQMLTLTRFVQWLRRLLWQWFGTDIATTSDGSRGEGDTKLVRVDAFTSPSTQFLDYFCSDGRCFSGCDRLRRAQVRRERRNNKRLRDAMFGGWQGNTV